MGRQTKTTSIEVEIDFLVPSRRLERLTYGLEGSCSIQLSYEGMSAQRVLYYRNVRYVFQGKNINYECKCLYNSNATSSGSSCASSSRVACFNVTMSG